MVGRDAIGSVATAIPEVHDRCPGSRSRGSPRSSWSPPSSAAPSSARSPRRPRHGSAAPGAAVVPGRRVARRRDERGLRRVPSCVRGEPRRGRIRAGPGREGGLDRHGRRGGRRRQADEGRGRPAQGTDRQGGRATGARLLAGRLARPRAALGVVKDGLTAAAGALGMTPAELGAKLRGGASLKDLATAKDVPYQVADATPSSARSSTTSTRPSPPGRSASRAPIASSTGSGRTWPTGGCATSAAAPGRVRHRARPDRRQLTRAQSKTTTWRSPSPARSRSKAGSRSSSPIRRSMSRSTGSRPSRWSAA